MFKGFCINDVEKVFRTMDCWRTLYFEPTWKGYEKLNKETKLPRRILSKIIKWMEAEGIIEMSYMIDEEGKMHGSGYFITDKYKNRSWNKVKSQIKSKFNSLTKWYNTTSILERRSLK